MDNLEVQGKFIFQFTDVKSGKLTRAYHVPNLITNVGKNYILRMLLDVVQYDTGLTYAALGDGDTAVNARDTTLDNEAVRAPIIQRADVQGTTASFIAFFSAGDLTSVTIEEVGIFGHTASAAANSGTLFSRAIRSISGSAGEDLSLTYVLRVV